jgi:hypothetical protein
MGASEQGPTVKRFSHDRAGLVHDGAFLVDTLALRKLTIDFGAANDEYYRGTADPDVEKIKNLP